MDFSKEDILAVLFDFVKRAASEKATPDEVQSLPGVAGLLLEAFR